MIKPANSAEGWEALSFANVLHGCLACGVLLIDDQPQVAALSDQARRLLGLAPHESRLPALEDLPAPVQSTIQATRAAGKAPGDRFLELESGNTGRRALRISAFPLQPDRKNSAVVLVLNDLTSARRLEASLDQLDRLANIGTLAAAMAHEIKNALVAGKTFIDLLLEKHQDAELVDVVRREVGRIDAIVSRMLRFAGPARPAFSQVHLHEVLDNSLRLVQPQREGRLISLHRSFQAGSDLVRGDDGQLQQVFVNLFLNAFEAMGPNGTLSVTTESVAPNGQAQSPGEKPEAEQLRVTVKDNGAGISPEDQARLFEPFFTTKPNGTGLGLPITRRIILQHHGHISVQSQPGQGTAFQILLPYNPTALPC
jgi:signal transduction histidine kinase